MPASRMLTARYRVWNMTFQLCRATRYGRADKSPVAHKNKETSEPGETPTLGRAFHLSPEERHLGYIYRLVMLLGFLGG